MPFPFTFLASVLEELGLSCEESQVEILQAAGDKTPQTFTDEINTKGATKFYLIRDARKITPATTVVATDIQGDVSNEGNSVDKDFSTSALMRDRNTVADAIIRYDFGSIATRNLAIIYSFPSNFDSTMKYKIGDTAGSGSDITIFNSSSSISKTTFFAAAASFRYMDITFTGNTSTITDLNVFEVYDANEGLGKIDFQMQIRDDARSSWNLLPDAPTIAELDTETGDQRTIDEFTLTMPHKASGLLRFVQDLDGKANYSCTLIKVNPCKA